ncbi:MAG: MFS transporter [Desulfurococcaceae archaeon]
MNNEKKILLIMVLLSAYALVYFHRTMTGVIKEQIDFFAKYYGFREDLLAAVFFSAYFYSYAFIQPVTGVLLDTYGVKKTCLLFLIGMSISTLIMAIPSPIALIVGRALTGVFASVVFASAQRTASLMLGSNRQATVTGLLLMIGNISTAIGTYPLLLFLKRHGLLELFYLLSLIALIMGIMTYVFSPDKGIKSKGLGLFDVYRGFRKIAKDPHAWAVPIGALGANTVLAFQGGWGQIYFKNLGVDKAEMSIYLMYLALTIAVLIPLLGYLSDTVVKKRKPFLVISNIAVVLSWALAVVILYNNRSDLSLYLVTLLGVSFSMHVTAPTMAKEPYGADYAAVSTGFFNVILFTSIAVILQISQLVKPAEMCIISMIIGLIGLTASLLLTRETYK